LSLHTIDSKGRFDDFNNIVLEGRQTAFKFTSHRAFRDGVVFDHAPESCTVYEVSCRKILTLSRARASARHPIISSLIIS
jgi:hypothetical protein